MQDAYTLRQMLTNAATQQLNSSCYSDSFTAYTLKIHSSRIGSSTGMEQCAVICYEQIMSSSLIPCGEKL